jgi:fermentation-respiration switch protein FrsA (DUF1100 family)
MQHILRHLEFREFLYESDPEYLVDMFRAFEVLEGSWFDTEETCRMYQKMVVRAGGTSWAIFFGSAIIGYADLIRNSDTAAFVGRWTIHPDFHHPAVVRTMTDSLTIEAAKRGFHSLTFYADKQETVDDLESIGWAKDRMYQWAMVGDVEPVPVASPPAVRTVKVGLEAVDHGYLSFLGSPQPPAFALAKAVMAAEYAVFHHRKPEFIEIAFGENTFLGCHDGREWFVLRSDKCPGDAEAIRLVLEALGEAKCGRILLSENAMTKADLVPANEERFWDFFLEF